MTSGNAYRCAQCGAVEAASRVEDYSGLGWLRLEPIADTSSTVVIGEGNVFRTIHRTILCSGDCALAYLSAKAESRRKAGAS
jgi:hypothetical protein